jgi:hypothetical protein
MVIMQCFTKCYLPYKLPYADAAISQLTSVVTDALNQARPCSPTKADFPVF